MSPKAKARCLTAGGAILGGALLLLPIPMFDVVLMAGVQLLIVLGVTLMLKKPVHFVRQGLFVCGYALVGSMVCLGFDVFVPLLGKFMLSPAFGLVWCYLLGELTMLSVGRR